MKFKDIKKYDLFYESNFICGNIQAVAMGDASETVLEDGKKQWRFNARCVHSGREIEYLSTEGLGHYGPKIYERPEYVKIKLGGVVTIPLFEGGDVTEADLLEGKISDPKLRAAWIDSGIKASFSYWDANPELHTRVSHLEEKLLEVSSEGRLTEFLDDLAHASFEGQAVNAMNSTDDEVSQEEILGSQSQTASDINNSGTSEQLIYLLETAGFTQDDLVTKFREECCSEPEVTP